MKGRIIAALRWVGRKLRAHFLAGILVTVPLGLTVWIFIWIFNGIDNLLQPVIERIFGHDIPGVGFGITVLIIYIVGVIVSNMLGRRLLRYGENLLNRVPMVRYVYNGIRQIMQAFAAPDKTGFMDVVLVEFPRKGTRTLGFITNETSDESGRKLLNIFIPTSPNPTSGFLQILSEDQVIRTNLTVDDALKMVVSGGRVSPREVSDKLFVGGGMHESGGY
ncbi:MAG TPA: DUF502 domain-containing protein [Dehalococcoidia bacterium]|nr:DUF502 domain-containing protein [Dehalococcoidia bacterium]